MANMSEKHDHQYHIEDSSSSKDLEHMTIEAEQLSPQEDRAILRKIDRNLLIIMALSYSFQFLDKSALSVTAILGLPKDLKLKGSDFSWASSIYYFGYLGFSYPAAYVIVRSPVGKMISASILIWGAVLMFTALCHNAGGLMAIRFVLGAAESAIGPALTVIISMWYKREEQPLRQGAWFLGNTAAATFGGLLAYGIAHIPTIAKWKAVFLIFGGITCAWSFFTFFLLPDTPSQARFLSEEERVKAMKRVESNMTGIKTNVWKWKQCFEALLDLNVWALLLINLCGNIANGGIQSFASIVIHGFGFSELNTLLVQMLLGVFQGIFVITGAVCCSRFKNIRTYFMAGNLLIALTGAVLIRQLPTHNYWGRFFGYCLTMGYVANFPLILSMSSSNVGGFTKKATVNAMIFISYCAGNIIGPQFFFQSQSPSYPSAFLAIIISVGIGFFSCFLLRLLLVTANKRRDRAEAAGEISETDSTNVNLAELNLTDKTDKDILKFRYVY